MIRVLQCVSNMDRAGIETMLMNYYRNINKNDFQFYFLCNKKKPGSYDDEILKMQGKIFYSPGLNPIKWFKYIKEVEKIIVDNKIDIVHVHNGALGLQSLIAAKKAGAKVRISHAHGTKIDLNLKTPLKLIYKKFLKRYATHYWGCGVEAIKYYYGEKVVNDKKYYLLTNAIDDNKFKFNDSIRNKIRKELNISDNEVLIGHVGRFMTQKNHKFLINVFKKICDLNLNYKLLLIGDGELMDECKKMVNKFGIQDKVIFLGNVPNTNEYYSAMDLFVLPSLFEGLPLVGIEAQANGLLCLFSDQISKEVDISGNVKFIELDTEKWKSDILKVKLSNRKIMDHLLEKSNYSIFTETKKLEKEYKKLLKEV